MATRVYLNKKNIPFFKKKKQKKEKRGQVLFFSFKKLVYLFIF